MSDDTLEALAARLLRELATEPVGTKVSLPRLGKRLQLEASVVLRTLTAMSAARIGEAVGPGWVEVAHDGERWRVALTPAGAEAAATLPSEDPR